jgi:sulfoxide reductase heme-binding subunit YedZ
MIKLLSKPWRITQRQQISLKTLIHIICAGWLFVTFYLGINDKLGADPVEALLNFSGKGAINLLFITLAISPLIRLIPAPGLIHFRRLLGIYCFVYALAHLLTYALFELQLNWALLGSEIIKRPYITVGFTALIILLALTVTSTKGMQRKLGRRWQRLHNGIYLVLLLALLHFSWSQKTLLQEPIIYWVLAIPLLYLRKDKLKRLLPSAQKKRQQ